MRRYFGPLACVVVATFGFAIAPSATRPAHAVPSCPASIAGGTVTADGNDCVLKWTTVGSYTWTVPAGVTTADVLVVAGGGGGGADAAGGGGAGGLIYEQAQAVSGTVSLTVGNGGVGGQISASRVAANGENSVFGALIAVGGGKGGVYRGGSGGAGGSGGGGGFDTGTAGAGTAGQGYAGADSGWAGWCACGIPGGAGGGGGGAGGTGTIGKNTDSNGGPGRQISITGTPTWYAAGGGGGRWSIVSTLENGGSGIGGRGAGSCGANPSTAGVANTGSGGGGAPAGCQTFGSAGGSGVVIVRYTPYVAPSTTTSTTTSTVAPATTTTVQPATTTTTAAPVLVINVSAPTTQPVTVSGAGPTTTVVTPKWTKSDLTRTTVSVPSTSTTTTIVRTATTTIAPPVPAKVASGGAAMTVDGLPRPAKVERQDNRIIVTTADARAEIAGFDPSGTQRPLQNNGNLLLQNGDAFVIKLAGFKSATLAQLFMFSSPVQLGEARVDENGAVEFRAVVPDSVENGIHRIVVRAVTQQGKSATFTFSVRIGDWAKERGIAPWIIAVPILLAVFGALFLPAAFRRRRSDANA